MARRDRKRQARLTFSPLPSSSAASEGYDQQIRNRAAAVNIDGSPTRHKSKRRRIDDHFSSTPQSSSMATSSAKPTTITLDDSDSDSPPPRSSVRTRNAFHPHGRTISLVSKGANSSSPALPTPERGANQPGSGAHGSRRRRNVRLNRTVDESNDLSGDADTTPSRKASDNFVDLGTDTDDLSDVVPTPVRKRTAVSNDSESEDDEQDSPPRSSVRRRLRQGRSSGQTLDPDGDQVSTGSSAADGESANGTTTGASSSKSSSRRRDLTTEEKQELEDELEGIKDSSSDEDLVPRQPTAHQKRQAALAQLMQRRARAQPSQPSTTITIPDDESSADEDEISADESEISKGNDNPVEDVPTSSAHDILGEHDSDDEMIDDDDENALLGAPADIPLEFTRYAAMKPRELFHFAIEWMVQKKLNPGFNGTDEIYRLAFAKLDDEVKGLAGSKFESSAWQKNFILALRARPQIAIGRMDKDDPQLMWKDKCDACNRSGHISTYEIQFQGVPYHPSTLEVIENDDDDEEEDDSDDSADDDENGETSRSHRDANGMEVLPQMHSFYVGKFCKANAETAHSLQHWRYHLYEWVVFYLQGEHELEPSKIVKRDAWGEPKRRKYANKVVDRMADTNKIKELYRDFKDEVTRAREAKQATWSHGSP